jgi:hypothetical protein
VMGISYVIRRIHLGISRASGIGGYAVDARHRTALSYVVYVTPGAMTVSDAVTGPALDASTAGKLMLVM